MTTLNLGTVQRSTRAFRIPLDVVTSTIAILARKGRGKTYTAAVLCEEFLDAGQIPVIIDPLGVWWGLKAGTGDHQGYPVVVFGGDHADLPLEETAGETIARAIVEQRFPAIIDLSHFRKGQSYRFLATFFEALYRLNRKDSQILHIIADEADYYAPQAPSGDQARVLGAMEDIVRRGRSRGIGCTLISQRPQVLAKNVLTQAEVLCTLGMNHPRDLKAIEEWVAVHGDPEKASLMMASLPSLKIGEAWFWAPTLEIFEFVAIRKRTTFDSSATPKPGEKVTAPKKLAEIDVAKLGKEISESAERAKENDPVELRKTIGQLRAELCRKIPPEAVKPIEISVVSDEDRGTIREIGQRLDKFADEINEANRSLSLLRQQAGKLLERVTGYHRPGQAVIKAEVRTIQMKSIPGVDGKKLYESGRHEIYYSAPNGDAPKFGTTLFGKAEKAILAAIAHRHPRQCTRAQAAILSGYSIQSSSFSNALSALRTAGLIMGTGDAMQLTDAGHRSDTVRSILDKPPPTADAVQGFWLGHLDRAPREILNHLIMAYPDAAPRSSIAAATNYSETSSSFSNALSTLRSLELITRDRDPRATEILFPT